MNAFSQQRWPQLLTVRGNAWKAVFSENRGEQFGVWMEAFTELWMLLIFNICGVPSKRPSITRTAMTTGDSAMLKYRCPCNRSLLDSCRPCRIIRPSQRLAAFNLDTIQKKSKTQPGVCRTSSSCKCRQP